MKVLYTGFKGKNNSSYQLLSKISGHKLFLTNSFKGLEKDIMNVTDKFDLVVMFGLDTSLKETVRTENVVSEIPTQYLCNTAYFNALHKFEGKAMFIHIPSLKNMSEDMMDRMP